MKVPAIALTLALAGCLARAEPPAAPVAAKPHPNSISAQLAGEWRHVPQPATERQLEQDKAACQAFSALVPDGAGSPGLRGTVAFLNCLKAKGYIPIPPQD